MTAESAVIDAAHIEHQRAWSTATFGPREQRGPAGPLAHIRKEVEEVAEDPTVLEEWVDVIILAFDGAWRAGHEPQDIIDAIKAKQAKNEARSWPDWRGVPDQAIEHLPSVQQWSVKAQNGMQVHTSIDVARKVAEGYKGFTLGNDNSPIVAALTRADEDAEWQPYWSGDPS